MTITVTDIVAGPYMATGLEQVLPFAFKVFTPEECEVYYGNFTFLDLNTDYTVQRNMSVSGAVEEGGTITMTAGAVPEGQSVTIVAKPNETQDQVYNNTGTRFSNLNEGLDRAAQRAIRAKYDGVLGGGGGEAAAAAGAAAGTSAGAAAGAAAAAAGLASRAAKAGDTFSGPVLVPLLASVVAPTSNIAEDYGLIDRMATVGALVQGTAVVPITTENYNKPAFYIERHVAGRNSEPPVGLTDRYLDSNWLLAPSFIVQTIVGDGGSNANASGHFRVLSNGGIGATPTATNPSVLNQAGMEGSVNCLCATVHTVHTNAPAGIKARPSWAINSEVRWTEGLAPDNMIIMEGDLINTGGGATSCIPASQNNFTGIWMQSAPRDAGITRKAGTTAFYVSCINFAGAGWMSAMTAISNIFQYGIYINNLATETGVATAGMLVTSDGGRNCWQRGYQASGNFTAWAAELTNGRNAASAGGLRVTSGRGNDDTSIVEFLSPSGLAFYATGDATNPCRVRLAGQISQLTKARLDQLVGANMVVISLT